MADNKFEVNYEGSNGAIIAFATNGLRDLGMNQEHVNLLIALIKAFVNEEGSKYMLSIEQIGNEIKAELKNLDNTMSVNFSNLSADVSGLKEDVSGLKEDVSGLKEDVSGLKERMAVVETRLEHVAKSVETLDKDTSVLKFGRFFRKS